MKQRLIFLLGLLYTTLFYASIFLLPTQLGKHWWPTWSYVLGRQIDYLSPTFYLTDLTVLGCIGVWFLSSILKKSLTSLNGKSFLILLCIGFVMSSNIMFSFRRELSLYGWFRNAELMLFGFCIYKTKPSITWIFRVLIVSVILVSSLALVQFITQKSVGGVFWLFGERTFNANTIGIAKTAFPLMTWFSSWFANERVMPYGTLPHPNVLAAFLVIVLTLLLYFLVQNSRYRAVTTLPFTFLLVVFIFCQSIASYIAIFFGIIGVFLLKFASNNHAIKISKIFTIFAVLCILMSVVLPSLPMFNLDEHPNMSIARRAKLQSVAIISILNRPILGAGAFNFIPLIPLYTMRYSTIFLQPVHNIYLLLVSEYGVIGIFSIAWLMWMLWSHLPKMPPTNKNSAKHLLFICIIELLILGLFDHYLITIQQGRMLFTLLLSLYLSKTQRPQGALNSNFL